MVKQIRKRIMAVIMTLALVISLLPAVTLPARAGVLGSTVTYSSTDNLGNYHEYGPNPVVNESDDSMEFVNLIDVDEGTIKLYFESETENAAFDLTFSGGSLDSISSISGPTWTNTGSWDDFMVGGAATIDPSNPKILHFEQIDPDPGSLNQVFTGYATWTFTTGSSNVAPTVTAVSVPPDGTYKIGDALDFTVSFDSVVVVTGTPWIPVTLDTGDTVYASYVSGSDSQDLVFRYTVSSGQLDTDGILLGSAINLNGGTIKTSGNDDAELDLHSVAATTSLLVDGVAPTITSVSPPSNATYIAGQNLDYTVNFSEAVNVVTTGGTPYLTLTVGSSTVHAAYQSGTGGSALTFRYTVVAGNADADGVALSPNITLNGATLKDAAGNDATLTFSGGTAADVKVSTVPTVTTTSVTAFTSTTATMGGNVTADGGETVTDRGVAYSSTDATPTIGEPGVTQDANGTGTGSFSESVTGLSPGTTYHVRAYATNSLGTVHGPVVSFTTSPAAPTAATGAASSITSAAATLNGTVNANGASSTVTFEYGITTAYGSGVTASQSPVTGTSSTSVSGSITGLVPNSTYHFRVIAVNSVNTTYGADQTFTTSTIAPTAETSSATNIVSNGATLNGTVNANNAQTTVYFEYGTTIGYGSTATASQSPVTGTSSTSVSCNITDLTPNTTYYYRVVAVNDGGTTYGSQKTFSTDVTAPTILSASRTDDTHITVTLSEASQNLTKANDGGFTVTKNGTATTFAVSATAQGADSSYVVLTVADMGAAGSAGVTVTYTAGGNGTIADIEGNEMETNTTGAVIAAWDTAAPTMLSALISAANTYIDITFSEGVYGAADGETALSAAKLALTFTQNGGTATNAFISSIKKNDNAVEGSASALVGGETTVRVFLTVTGTPNGLETIEIKPANGSSVYDKAGNSMLINQTSGVKTLNDQTPPTLVSAIRTDDTHITVTLSKNCDQITKANHGGFTVTETGAPGTQYSVSAIAQGTDASHIVLTVANLGISAKEGVTVKYTAGGNGTVADTLGNAMETDATGVSIAPWDTTPPTISSAGRTDDTHITITLSEACQNLAKANDGGFTVTKTGAATTYEVSATSAGAGNTLVLTVADISSAGAVGVTIAYTAGTNGTIADIAGNALETDGTGKAVAAWDTTAPTVSGVENGGFYNTPRTATFDEGTATLDGNPVTSPITVADEGSHMLTVTDAAGNSTTVTFTIDKTAPTGTLSINNGDAYTTSLDVVLTITSSDGTGSGVSQMRFSLDGSSWSPWEAVSGTESGSLAADYGTVTVYLQLKDNAGNVSANITDTIRYKSIPTASNSTNTGTEDAALAFDAGDFSFSNADSASLEKVKIKSLPSNGTLKLGSTDISAEDEISAANLSDITFVPNTNWNGSTGFNWIGYDGTLWTGEATVTITLADDGDTAASASSNTVSVSQSSVLAGTAVTITASGDRQSEAGAVAGDEKYVPATWSSSESGHSGSFALSGGTYTASYTPSAGGTYTITATYQKMIWNGTSWVNSTTDTKTATVTVTSPSGGGGSNTTAPPTNTVVEVNGQKQDAGTASTQTTGGQTVTTIKVDDTKLDKLLASSGEKPTVTLPTNKASDVVVGELNGQTVKNMEQKEAILEIKTETVTYTLPASQINIDAVSSQLGAQVELKDIKVNVKIATPPADTVKIVENTAEKNSYQIVVKPVEFEITCTSGDTTVEVSRFNGYVERTIAIPDGIDPSKITTGIVLNTDGTFSHVPTQIVVINGKYYAKINSLTNSTYSVIYNPVAFTDVAGHWAKDAVNNMGSRMVVMGIGNSTYEPDRIITRAEFAAIVVRALGLRQGTNESSFGDVTLTNWFNGYVDTAASYSLIAGYNSTTFAPDDTITREQAMTILARAMKLTGLSVTLTDSEVSALLSNYTDAGLVSDYAKAGAAACIKNGVVSGTTASTLSPKDSVTRAEVAVMVQRLLQESGLI